MAGIPLYLIRDLLFGISYEKNPGSFLSKGLMFIAEALSQQLKLIKVWWWRLEVALKSCWTKMDSKIFVSLVLLLLHFEASLGKFFFIGARFDANDGFYLSANKD